MESIPADEGEKLEGTDIIIWLQGQLRERGGSEGTWACQQ